VSEQKTRITLATVLAVVLVSLIVGAGYRFFPAQEPSSNPVILPMPISSPNTTFDRAAMQLDVRLSQYPNSTESFKFNITQSSSIKINVTLSSLSKQTEFTIPLYLSVGAFQNQPFTKVITSPPTPYPALPWPSHDDSPAAPKPFEASFDPNPLILKPNESKTTILTITALEDAALGTYTMLVEMGNWEQTGLGGATFQLTVVPK
jgi:hypothetical protein